MPLSVVVCKLAGPPGSGSTGGCSARLGQDFFQLWSTAALEIGRADLPAIDQAQNQGVDKGPKLFQEIEHERRPAVSRLVKETDQGIKPAAEHFRFDHGAQESIAKRKAGIDGIPGRPAGSPRKFQVRVARELAEMAKYRAAPSPSRPAAGRDLPRAGTDRAGAQAAQAFGQVRVLELPLGAQEQLALMGQLAGHHGAGDAAQKAGSRAR